jgi:hypothetical protein
MPFSVMTQSRWLCKLAGKQALQQQAAALLRTPTPPYMFTFMVQLAGLQMTAADLVAAARSRTPGVENWVLPEFSKQLDPLVKAMHKASEVRAIPAANTCMVGRLQETFVTMLATSFCNTVSHELMKQRLCVRLCTVCLQEGFAKAFVAAVSCCNCQHDCLPASVQQQLRRVLAGSSSMLSFLFCTID